MKKQDAKIESVTDNFAGYVVLIQYYNSKNPYSRNNAWHIVKRHYTTINGRRTLVGFIWSCVGDLTHDLFHTKKEATAYLKSVKHEIETNDPKSFNLCENYYPDRFKYKVVKAHIKSQITFD